MTGGESLFRTLLAGGIEVCFTTAPVAGTAWAVTFERVCGIRFVAGFDERIATGAANGYARMAERPVATLLFSGPGLAQGTANFRSAASAHLPIVNLIVAPPPGSAPAAGSGLGSAGERRRGDRGSAPAIEEVARPYSGWLRVAAGPEDLGRDAADALLAARMAPGRVASLIVPEEFLAAGGGRTAAVFNPPRAPMPEVAAISRVAALLLERAPAAILLGATASCGDALITAGRVAAATGAALLAPGEVRRIRRGAGLAAVGRIPSGPGAARRCLQRFRLLVLAGVPAPRLEPVDGADVGDPRSGDPRTGDPRTGDPRTGDPRTDAGPMGAVGRMVTLARPEEDVSGALEALVVALAAHATAPRTEAERRPPPAGGPITEAGIAAVIGSLLPDQAVVADAASPTGREIFAACRGAPAHDWMVSPGGPGGVGLLLAAGAAIACPDRPVLCLVGEADGAPAMQALWTMARDGRCVTVVMFAPRGARRSTEPAMEGAESMAPAGFAERVPAFPDRDGVAGDRIALAREMGVPGQRVDTLEALAEALRGGFASGGRSLIEVPL